jgi:two-component system, LytTR family, sensor kinase
LPALLVMKQLSYIGITKKRLILLFLLFWLFITFSVYAGDLLAKYLGAAPLPPVDKVQYALRWLIWALLSPLILYFATKFPFRRETIIHNIITHILLAVLILFIEFAIEVPIMRYLVQDKFGVNETLKAYLVPYVLKFYVYVTIYFALNGIVNLLFYLSKIHQNQLEAERMQKQLIQAQLQTLKMQLQPHFLFNTHNTIVGLMLKNETGKAIKMLTMLSDFLRYTLDNQEEQLTTLRKELTFLKMYLDMHQIRFENRLTTIIDAGEEALSCYLPHLILQPFVENAIKHGFTSSDYKGIIEIKASKNKEQLHIEITDNGTSQTAELAEGVGLRNSKTRLKELYGTNYLIELVRNKNNGITVKLQLPYQL